ncbi:hypothetical protein NUW54_g11685 [Trametes sanguinea]|uniref:Uncharacterized protein n=1 Tax=Trametes sanguinea TaxID=158606 RepID=A0ACC1N9Z9_9APHY|nr:hypothetical protein NUW54_g11685 [Trametes sanguinea]
MLWIPSVTTRSLPVFKAAFSCGRPRTLTAFAGAAQQSACPTVHTGAINRIRASGHFESARLRPQISRYLSTTTMNPDTTDTPLKPSEPAMGAEVQSQPEMMVTDNSPTLILIFGWLGAKKPTLQKYSDAYRGLYPSSAQLLVNADTLRFWKLPSVRVRSRYGARGVCSLVDLASAMRRRGLQAPAGTKCAIVFDSAPAPVTFSIMNRAFTAAIRSTLKKYLAMAILSTVYLCTRLIQILFRRPKAMEYEMAALNDPAFLPWTSKRTPRLYLYSSGDTIVPAPGVEQHMNQARSVGFPVHSVHFGQSAHVSHARNDPEKYWNSIKSFWEEANR